MSRGFCIVAQNNSTVNYVEQAYYLACSIHQHNNGQNISLITNDEVPDEWKNVFDNIIPIPWGDAAVDKDWKVENRWKVYHVTPYDETIVMDTDMLVVKDIDHWWKCLEKYNLYFVNEVYDYRNLKVNTNKYRKIFEANYLPNIYTGIYYFKKCEEAKQFFKLVELITYNWELFYGEFASIVYQTWYSYDLTCAIAIKILNNENFVTSKNSPITFVHFKPHAQKWINVPEKCTDVVGCYYTNDKDLFIGNFLQDKVLHYVEKDFLKEGMKENLKI